MRRFLYGSPNKIGYSSGGRQAPSIELANGKEIKTFIKFPWSIYSGDPNWVPPLILDQLQFFTPGRNPYFSHSAAQLFMAFRGDEPVGRISAHENNQHIRVHRDGAGFFGFFECIDDQAVASALQAQAAVGLAEAIAAPILS